MAITACKLCERLVMIEYCNLFDIGPGGIAIMDVANNRIIISVACLITASHIIGHIPHHCGNPNPDHNPNPNAHDTLTRNRRRKKQYRFPTRLTCNLVPNFSGISF